MTKALELRHVSKTYGAGPSEVHALTEIDLTVEHGEPVAVMGPSGSGKSTLLFVMGGLDRPQSGMVRIEGTDWSTLEGDDAAQFRRRTCGMIRRSNGSSGHAACLDRSCTQSTEIRLR